jgi:hypothetical protein
VSNITQKCFLHYGYHGNPFVVRLQLKLTIKIEKKRISCSKHDLKLTQESSLIKLTQTEYETYKEFCIIAHIDHKNTLADRCDKLA